MSKRITVLGGGLVGATIARDLASQGFDVLVADRDREALGQLQKSVPVRARLADLAHAWEIQDLIADADVVVGSLPGRLGSGMLRSVLEAGKSIADISFSAEDPLAWNSLARQRGATAVVDCGVSPGLSNFAVGRAAQALDEVEDVTILAGGLPAERSRPYQYAIVFSATDVLEEYTRPARVLEDGHLVKRPALSGLETIEIQGLGTFEAFLTDGLRTLLSTVPARGMREKTLRYPGHAEQMRLLRDCGFFASEAIDVGVVRVAPRALTERLLREAWKLSDGEEEFTLMRVTVIGRKAGKRRRYVFEILDRTDQSTGTTSMARTTGYPCAIVAGMLARGEYRQPGVVAPEMLARDAATAAHFLEGLKARGISWTETEEEV
ncbi:MAG TPA: saccharopine dehydrogenase C-terminal domain-containing protein [Thermoanaerobaculia bacterium]|nr:saccharopine dehydrogenase C-terminal domain-containing protein [Thermoanaerobaculia bacterium]